MKKYEADTAAEAVILVDYGNLEMDFLSGEPRYTFERLRRIKILKRAGFDYGDVALTYYSEGHVEKIKFLKAMIHQPNGKSIKLSKKDFFEEKLDDSHTRVKFTFPDLQEGSVIEYTYSLNSSSIFTLPEWYFQHNIPTVHSEYLVAIPEWYDYVMLKQGKELDINTSESQTQNVTVNLNRDQSLRTETGSANILINYRRMVMKNAAALREEEYITTMDDYRARVRFQLQGTRINGIVNPIMSSWEKSVQELMEHSHFGDQFSRKAQFRKAWNEVEPLLSQANSELEKAAIIYNFVNSTIEWNEEYNFFVETNLNDCFEQKKANSGELNHLLLGLLNEAGVQAFPLLVSTRNHGKMVELYPILTQFNHMMVLAYIEKQATIMDAGNQHRPIGIPRVSALNNHRAFLAHPSNPQWIDLPKNNSELLHYAKVQLDEDGILHGSVSEKHKGYAAANIRAGLSSEDGEKVFEEAYVKYFPDIEVNKINLSDLEDINKPLKAVIDFDMPERAQVNGDYIYFSPFLLKIFEENPFKLESRDYPVDFPYPMTERYVMVMDLPKDYDVEEFPEELMIALPNQGGHFRYTWKKVNNQVHLNADFKLDQLQFTPAEYGALKNFVGMILEKQEEQLVLKLKEE